MGSDRRYRFVTRYFKSLKHGMHAPLDAEPIYQTSLLGLSPGLV